MADDFASAGHVISGNMADDQPLADSVATNLTLTFNMLSNDVECKKYGG
jgi:hypothetical protein